MYVRNILLRHIKGQKQTSSTADPNFNHEFKATADEYQTEPNHHRRKYYMTLNNELKSTNTIFTVLTNEFRIQNVLIVASISSDHKMNN